MSEARHAFTLNRVPDVPMADGSTVLGALVLTVSPEAVDFAEVLQLVDLLSAAYPRRSLAVYYAPAAVPTEPHGARQRLGPEDRPHGEGASA